MAGATGAVIVRDDGKNMQWRDKCEGCGYVSSCVHHMSSPSQGTIVHAGVYCCPQCRHTSQITIYG
jgi:uncharacterized cysteine cluster protein YcgN (CxxCxxCC family)